MTLENGPDAFDSVSWSKHKLRVVTDLMSVSKELVYAFVASSAVGVDRTRLVYMVEKKSVGRTLSSIGHNPHDHLLHLAAPSPKYNLLVSISTSAHKGLVNLDIALKFLGAGIDQVLPKTSVPTTGGDERN